MRKSAVLLLLLAIGLSAAPVKPARTVAPEALPHNIALFLGTLSDDGGRQVTFKATAVGMRFFFEEPGGVTVYRYEDGRYIREEFLRGFTLKKAVSKHATK